MSEPVSALELKLGYRFSNPELLVRALTHRSRASELPSPSNSSADNEQLEFLGDSILGFIVSEALVTREPAAREGQLSQRKAQLVSSAHLYLCALSLNLGSFLILGKGEEKNGGRERRTLLANAMEAIIAAIHLDGGIEAAKSFVYHHVLDSLGDTAGMAGLTLLNYKSALQEKLQAMGLPPPHYTIVETSGPEHAKLFTVEATVGGQLVGRATGSSKKTASQQAAQRLIDQLAQVLSSPAGTY